MNAEASRETRNLELSPVEAEPARIEQSAETAGEVTARPTLDEVELERPKEVSPRNLAVEGRARKEYFLYLHGRSELQNEIREALRRPRFPGRTFEALVLRTILELLRQRLEGTEKQRSGGRAY